MRSLKMLFILSIIFLWSCSGESNDEKPVDPSPPTIETIKIPSYTQRNGNAAAGLEYLTSGDYLSSGIPYEVFIRGFGEDNSNVLNRTGDNAKIKYEFTAVNAPNGTRIVALNCLQCHASTVNNKFIIGLGSHDYDFTVNREGIISALNILMNTLYGQNSNEWKAYDQFRKSITAIGSKTITKTRGSNPADKITQVLVAHRDKNTLEWSDTPKVAIPDDVIPTDVPAWWLLKKKNAMFYHAIARQDFCRSMIASSLLTATSLDKVKEVDTKMPDILAYIKSLEAPKYPFSTNTTLANRGKQLFENKCAQCHDTYGTNSTYPNLLVSLKTIGTDAALSNHYSGTSAVNTYFIDWFNTGWFGSGVNSLKVMPEGGYVAPPLDGIWATAPYFHNGSVPTLEDVLNSTARPTYWSRIFNNSDYDKTKVGWVYKTESSKIDKNTYDTTLMGHGKQGHTFGDNLTNDERKAIIEYLKTL